MKQPSMMAEDIVRVVAVINYIDVTPISCQTWNCRMISSILQAADVSGALTNRKRLPRLATTPLNRKSLTNPSVVSTEPDGRLQLLIGIGEVDINQTEY
ncbi:hypothetical protein Pyn_03559 [Prunus yedoensis var. nudiflora]|uniref:Uncharacterized protein n=1 Tax=Prunus yedoensis var. nudiflora TaxID=2094558 RepID=A0A314US83_PRUYE|nr:hypothetical protein Pyn_03559 [Prunus yedoensis var. nudiflora]